MGKRRRLPHHEHILTFAVDHLKKMPPEKVTPQVVCWGAAMSKSNKLPTTKIRMSGDEKRFDVRFIDGQGNVVVDETVVLPNGSSGSQMASAVAAVINAHSDRTNITATLLPPKVVSLAGRVTHP